MTGRRRTLSRFLKSSAAGLIVIPVLISLLAAPAIDAPVARAASPGPVFVQAGSTTTSLQLSFTKPVAAGDLLVAGITTNDAGNDPVNAVSDNVNGAWARITSLKYGNGHVELYYLANSIAAAVTVTFSTINSSKQAFTIADYSGLLTASPLDQFAARARTGTPTAGPTASITGPGELVVGVGGMSAPTSFSAGTGFTLRAQAVSNYLYADGLEDAVTSSSAGQSMTMGASTNTGTYSGAVVAVFRAQVARPPTAALAVAPASGAAPLGVTADASASTAGTNPITNYTFSFGDNTPLVGPQSQPTAGHTFNSGGTFTVSVTVVDSAGNAGTATKTVTVGAPMAALSVKPNAGAAPLGVTADGSGSTDPLGISSYSFSFGDSTPTVGPQPQPTATHNYTSAGTYTVTLTVSDSTGASATTTATVTVVAPPSAALSVTPNSGPGPLTVTGDASASSPGTNPIASFTFNFGDATPVVGPQAQATAGHTYSSGGSFTVTVTVTDSAGYTSAATQAVTVGQPKAVLSVKPSSGAPPVGVTADASGSSDPVGITGYTFNFGDNTPTVGPQAQPTAGHTYTSAGTYTATLTVSDGTGASATTTATVTVVAPPSAALSVTPNSGPAPLAVAVDASASSAGTNPIAGYTFNFGDGTAAVGPQAQATAGHTYNHGGTFTVTVTVTDSAGYSSAASQTVIVGQPMAVLSVKPNAGALPLAVTADGSGSSDPIGITGYTFDFGDNTPTVGPQAQPTAGHTYTLAGTYTVTLTITDSTGASTTATATVTVVAPPSAALSVTPSSGPAPLAVAADASASTGGTNPIASYTFNFGDNTPVVGPQTQAGANHTYNTGGTFTVTVTVTDSGGYASSASQTVIVGQPKAVLSVKPNAGALPLAVTADGSSSTDPVGFTGYAFNFGDNTPTVGPQPQATASHTYNASGTYTVTLTVTDVTGASATTTATVTVWVPPTASLKVTPNSGAAPLAAAADASASTPGTNPIASYTFNFGDGTATVGPQAQALANHTFSSGGTYTVTVTVTDSVGLTSTATATVTAINGTITGTLTDSSTGAPLAGAQVSTQPATSTVTTNSSGIYQISAPSGSYNVLFSASGYNNNFATVTVSGGATASANVSLIAVPSLVAQDLFTRPNQTGIGQASDGHTWTDDLASNPSVVVQITNSQLYLGTTGSTYDAWMGYPYQDEEVAADVYISSGSARLLARVQGNGTWVVLTVTPNSNNLVLWVTKNNQWTQLKAWAAAPVLTQNTWYHAKLRAVGQNVYGKAWVFGSPEPAWQLSATQSQVTGAGVAGLRSSGSTGYFSNFSESPVTQVTGVVTDASTGAGITGATVRLNTGTSTTTDSTGAYVLSGLVSGTYTVTASAPGYTAASQQISVPTGVSSGANLALTPSAPPPPPTGDSNVVGTVTDSATGAPIAGATVASQPATTSATTDNYGNYLLTVPAGPYFILFSTGGYNSDFATVTTTSGGTSTINMTLARVPAFGAQDTFNRPDQTGIGVASDGHVWTDDHAVYPTGTEQISSRRLWGQTFTATTDYDAWMGIPYQDEQVTLDFNAVKGPARVLARVQASETWIVLAINPSNSNVVLWAANNNVWTQLATAGGITVAQNSWYHAKLAVIGQKVFGKVWAFGAPEPSWQVSATQTIVTGTGVAGLRLAGTDAYITNFLEIPITQISGTVSDSASGKPVANASVSLSNGAATTTDANGNYMVGSLAAGTYTVTVTAPGYGSTSLSVSVATGVSATANLTITSAPPPANSQITGSLTDSVTGAPIVGAQVSTQPVSATATTDSTGAYQLAVGAGNYNVIFAASGYNSNFKPVAVSAGATVSANQTLVPVPSLVAQDLFSRPNQNGVGPASDGHTWTDDLASNPSAVVQIANQQLYTQTSSGTAFDAWMGYQYQDEEVDVDFMMVAGGARLLARVQGSNNWLVLAVTPGSNGSLVLWAAKNNQWTQLKTWTTTPALNQGTWYHAKLRVVGQTVSAKVWAYGATEPGWQITTTQSIVSGVGVGGLRTSSATTYFTNYSEMPVTQIAGTVISNATKQPIAGATVALSNGATTVTDSSGNYAFAKVNPGTYTVTASATGYTNVSQSASVSTGVSATANFAL